MKLYLEIFDYSNYDPKVEGAVVPMVRIEVDTEDIDELKSKAEQIASFLGFKEYKAQLHKCYNDEEEPKPCEIIEIPTS